MGQIALSTVSQTGLAVNYYASFPDYNADITIEEPESYSNIANAQTIFLRVYEIADPSNFGMTTATLKVNPLPLIPTIPVPPMIVYNANSDFGSFNLNQQLPYILSNPNDVVTFYETSDDAQTGVNPLPTTCYVNISNPQSVYFRILTMNGCFVVASFDLMVSNQPNPNPTITFPDSTFEQVLLSANTSNTIALDFCFQPVIVDVNSDGAIQTDEAARVWGLQIGGMGISSVQGIQNFTGMRLLRCENNSLTDLPISGLTNLTSVYCQENQLTHLDCSQTGVNYVWCNDNNLEWVNVMNGKMQISSDENPGNWANNPNLSMVCADVNELEIINEVLSYNGYSILAASDCQMSLSDNAIAKPALYPNPARNSITIKAEENINTIQIFDLQARPMLYKDAHSVASEFSFDISSLASGTYFVKVQTGSGQNNLKFIKY